MMMKEQRNFFDLIFIESEMVSVVLQLRDGGILGMRRKTDTYKGIGLQHNALSLFAPPQLGKTNDLLP